MRWNKIDFPVGSTSLDVYNTPMCMNRGSLKKFIKDFKRYKAMDANYPNWSDLDMKEGEPIAGGVETTREPIGTEEAESV